MNLSEHFTLEELTNTSHKNCIEKNKEFALKNKGKLVSLCDTILEQARLLVGPMIISSGVRCPELNKAVGGSATSQHCLCEAADFIPTKMSVEDAFEILCNSNIQFGQLILEVVGKKRWIHISLGYPHRAAKKCREKLFYDGKKYVKIK